MLAAVKMPSLIILPLGIKPCLPAMRKSAHNIDIKTEDIATLRGEESPKNNAISLPDEKPAPIAVPTYNAAVLNAFFTPNNMFYAEKICRKTRKTQEKPALSIGNILF